MADLVGAQFPQFNPFQSLIGQPGTVLQSNLPARSNLEYLGLASAADAAALTTNKLVCVAVPVDIGVTYSKVTFVAGATAPTLTINYAAVYAGGLLAAAQTLLAQSANAGATAPTVSQANSYTLATPQTASLANAPYGYWFVGLQQTGTANSAMAVSVAAAIQVMQAAVFTHAPIALAFNVAATTGTAPATLASPTIQANAPFVCLT
jgi:hypothetical protein